MQYHVVGTTCITGNASGACLDAVGGNTGITGNAAHAGVDTMGFNTGLGGNDTIPRRASIGGMTGTSTVSSYASNALDPPVTIDRSALQRVIAVINGKGGVQKTTLVANIGGLYAGSGYHCLLVDLDPQGNLAEDLGYTDTDTDDSGKALAGALAFGGAPIPVTVRPNLDVLVGGYHLNAAAAALTNMASRDSKKARLALAEILTPLAANYDIILIDCPPGNEPLQAAAVAAARWAVVPVKTDQSSRKGLLEVARRLDDVMDVNPGLDLLGVVLVGVGSSAHRIKQTARDLISEALGGDQRIFTASIRHSEATAQAAREQGLLVHELDEQVRKGPSWWQIRRGEGTGANAGPRTAQSVADDLQALAKEIVDSITVAEEGVPV